KTCLKACEGIHKVSHQAALGSVPRSIENPMQSTEVNILGTVNLMYAAVQQKIERIILAFSSSTYGDHPDLPKVEEYIGNPLSPYAATKAAVEQFAYVFGITYGLNWIGLRYFNVFGPKQNPDNPYAAVIPIFAKAILTNGEITVNGNGETSRDFTYVQNAIQMNDLSLFTKSKVALNQIYNTACSDRITLNEMIKELSKITGCKANVNYGPERKGDVKHSEASIQKAKVFLGYKPSYTFQEGLFETIQWYKKNII
ncbi:GDP-mannose 4,6-dehydratase, partial [Balneolaceae bacterium]|nr:GDP-mannose 4,6-dehydratase [Balneolaceae bacterium]